MWLINTNTFELRMFNGPQNVPPYAILSHTWGNDEVTFQDIQQNLHLARTQAGFSKIEGTCYQALRHQIDWAWIDSCCIDKTSSAELSEAINSMYSYYLLARVCFVYLCDVPPPSASPPMGNMPSLARSRWFTRGWTLQELIAPRRAIFYASDWSRIGTKGLHRGEQPFIAAIAAITGVFESVLSKTRSPRDYSIAERMSWAAARQTTRPEDLAYCVMGLFGVNIPVLYGEGLTHAFQRLQHEIIRTSPDETIFAWRVDPAQEFMDSHTGERRRRALNSGLLADSPADFARSRDVHQRALHRGSPFRLFSMTNMGISITAELITLAAPGSPRASPRTSPSPGRPSPSPSVQPPESNLVILPIGASDRPTDTGPRARVGLYLEPVLPAPALPSGAAPSAYSQVFYRRVRCDDFCFAPQPIGDFPRGHEQEIFILEDEQFAEMRWADRPSSAGGGSPSIGGRLSLSPSASPRASPRLGTMDLT
ncbi:Vegetative incompatibility protein HET-E-1 [Colletotrichum aenigma]|uniref:Vegetative incompatibility protein HET-E-1 n=1 Tax=Colletotrichum aenigma TaxID=1215731 RepID=UPI0018730456|nr:Vegetative incompatibility protein HET-E-1 [Colletotrichum aenigma]KAF5520902.1 Vegetative incompatibility protein HET-E-1 [Colletotrichum aenigma]